MPILFFIIVFYYLFYYYFLFCTLDIVIGKRFCLRNMMGRIQGTHWYNDCLPTTKCFELCLFPEGTIIACFPFWFPDVGREGQKNDLLLFLLQTTWLVSCLETFYNSVSTIRLWDPWSNKSVKM